MSMVSKIYQIADRLAANPLSPPPSQPEFTRNKLEELDDFNHPHKESQLMKEKSPIIDLDVLSYALRGYTAHRL
jgi:hypothetical protein